MVSLVETATSIARKWSDGLTFAHDPKQSLVSQFKRREPHIEHNIPSTCASLNPSICASLVRTELSRWIQHAQYDCDNPSFEDQSRAREQK
jgi:hypothetical protein